MLPASSSLLVSFSYPSSSYLPFLHSSSTTVTSPSSRLIAMFSSTSLPHSRLAHSPFRITLESQHQNDLLTSQSHTPLDSTISFSIGTRCTSRILHAQLFAYRCCGTRSLGFSLALPCIPDTFCRQQPALLFFKSFVPRKFHLHTQNSLQSRKTRSPSTKTHRSALHIKPGMRGKKVLMT